MEKRKCYVCGKEFIPQREKDKSCNICAYDPVKTIKCKQCGKNFHLSASNVKFYEDNKLELPKRCKNCIMCIKEGKK